MFATYAYSPHLVPTTPPPTFYYDGAAIVDDSIYDESDTRSACQASPPCSVPQFMVPGAILPLPLALARTSSKPLRLRPETEASPTPSLVMDQGSVRRKMDMNMAATGSVAAQPGIHTPLASHAGEWILCRRRSR